MRTENPLPIPGYVMLVLMFVANLSFAAGCDDDMGAYTIPRTFELGGQNTKYEVLDETNGNYIVLFENGDFLIASFEQCGLGLHAHYYSTRDLGTPARRERLRWMVAAVLPSREAFEEVEPQLKQLPTPDDGTVLRLTTAFDSHDLTFGVSESPLFRTVIHYRWNAPLY